MKRSGLVWLVMLISLLSPPSVYAQTPSSRDTDRPADFLDLPVVVWSSHDKYLDRSRTRGVEEASLELKNFMIETLTEEDGEQRIGPIKLLVHRLYKKSGFEVEFDRQLEWARQVIRYDRQEFDELLHRLDAQRHIERNSVGADKNEKITRLYDNLIFYIRKLALVEGSQVAAFLETTDYLERGLGVGAGLLWRLASDGYAPAQALLAERTHLGLDIALLGFDREVDHADAYYWARLAQLREIDMNSLINNIRKHLSEAEIAKTEERIKSYRPTNLLAPMYGPNPR